MIVPQAVGAAFRHPCPAHRVVSACGNVVLLQSIGTVRCQLPLAQAFGAALGQLPFSQTISPTFGDLILLELPFSQAIGATFGDLILLETLRTIGSQLWFLGAVCTPLGSVVHGRVGAGRSGARFGGLCVGREQTEGRKEGKSYCKAGVFIMFT
jgi:hypothetical protein